MRVINASVSLESDFDPDKILRLIERAGRVCYKSEDRIAEGSAEKLIRNLISRGHESVLEHASITFRVICDRGVSHEFVRHRIASYSQESTRYCNYAGGKFGGELTFIKPCFWSDGDRNYERWLRIMSTIEKTYLEMISDGALPQEARSILPNSLKTELFVTMNIREWRHFLRLRTDKKAHPQMREVALRIYEILSKELPVLFADIDAD